ncbi:amine dehydrogenase [Halomonas sp. KAO]|uniref:amine dehydrogenase large subunit n=1 Tax=Halomonas sp. KAO TaxID=2783858 RepID=UPI00189EBCCF|nr:amine dehydrogenase large subunit [Halomonas sp. KAO]MBF7054592.1 amine dehydrogenase [Halomonas sp. KAO]
MLKKSLYRTGLAVSLSSLLISTAWAQLARESYSIETLDEPDQHRTYIVDNNFTHALSTRIRVVDPDEQKLLGTISTGYMAPMVLSHDKSTIYTADIFYARGTRGERTDVLTATDAQTLNPLWEVELPAKLANMLTELYMLTISDDDRFVYAYNFTPATSITVVDVKNQEMVNEIEIPGCMLNYPVGDRAFASICGDGTLQKVVIDDQGQEVSRSKTRFFDPDKELMNERAILNGDTYYFTTTDGVIQPVHIVDGELQAGERWSLFGEDHQQENWGVGGWQLLAASPHLNRLYALVHPDHEPRKWEDPSDTVWAYDLESGEKVGEITLPNHVWSIHVTKDESPLLLGGTVEGDMEVYDLSQDSHVATMEEIAGTPILMLSH